MRIHVSLEVQKHQFRKLILLRSELRLVVKVLHTDLGSLHLHHGRSSEHLLLELELLLGVVGEHYYNVLYIL